MKRAKLLSLFLAGSLLFQTAGIEAMAAAPSESAPISETAEEAESDFSEQPSEAESESKESAEEESDSEQPSEEESEEKDPAVEEQNPEQPSDEENEEKDSDGEESNPEQPSDEENEGNLSDEEEGENKDSVSENTVSENTISENTISEDTNPGDELSVFSIFPGLGDDYKFSTQQLADKRNLASHVGDIVQIDSPKTATIADYQDTEGEYELGEVVYLAETKEEAEQVAEAFGGTVDSYSYEVAVISLPDKATVALAIAAAAEPDIKLPAVWPNYYHYLHNDTNSTINPLNPSDTYFDRQWQHDYIGTRYAWAAGFKGDGVKVAVIDTGLNQNHEDLKSNALQGKTFVDDAAGASQNTDNGQHGTHVAGIIAADDNGVGVIGIAPDAKVRGYSVFSTDERCTAAWIERAICDAVADGNDIINMSLGSPNYDNNYEKIVNDAYEAGVAIFASSGNDDSNGNNFPAAYANTISVGAIDENSARASFSNFGNTVTLAFPGVYIYSTVPTGYGYMSGTSQASPAAAGTAAVILSARSDIRGMSGKNRVNALLSAMKSSTTKCVNSGMGAGTTYLPGVLKIATDMTAPETPVIKVVNEDSYERGTNNKDYIAQSIEVIISSDTAVGVDIYYSTDGKVPTYKNGAIINAENEIPYQLGNKITLTGAKSKTIKAIAVNPISGKVSKVASKTVTLTPIPTGVTVSHVDNVTKVAAGKSLKFTAAVTPSYAISNKVQWTVVDADKKDAKDKGVMVTNGTVKASASTPAAVYTVIATAVGNDGKAFNGVIGKYDFTVIESAAIKKVAFVDADTKKAPKAKSIKTTDSKTTDTGKSIDLKEYLNVTKTTDAASKTDTTLTGDPAAQEVVWSSSNAKVATVSNGVINAEGPGKATIKAISNDGGNKSASYTVTVVRPVDKITITGPQKVAAGKGIALTATVTPSDASNKKVEWTVVDSTGKASDKVSINKSNGKISTKKDASGTYTVTATAADKFGSSITHTITIVTEEITKITLNSKKLTMFPPNTSASNNTTETLSAKVEGKVAGNSVAEVLHEPLITWTSSAPSIASVNQSGQIIAKAPGKATITCAATDGSNKKATCTVTVATPMSKLVIGPTDGNEGDIAVGKKVKMAAKYYSNYGTPTNKKVIWQICGYGEKELEGKVSIDKNSGTVSVDKSVTPTNKSYVGIQAIAQDGSGVQSNIYHLYIQKNYLTARIVLTKQGFMVQATTEKTSPKNDKAKWEYIADYATATLSAPKNCGLYKRRFQTEANGPIYAGYSPQPTKHSKNKALEGFLVPTSVLNKEAQKMTLTVKLKDGSNLSAKLTLYAVYYYDDLYYFY